MGKCTILLKSTDTTYVEVAKQPFNVGIVRYDDRCVTRVILNDRAGFLSTFVDISDEVLLSDQWNSMAVCGLAWEALLRNTHDAVEEMWRSRFTSYSTSYNLGRPLLL